MSLQTYVPTLDEGPEAWPICLIDDPGPRRRRARGNAFFPGDTVRTPTCGGYGTVVASSWSQVTVLWSEEPAMPVGRFDPLGVDEDVWVPIRNGPIPARVDAESVSLVTRILGRMFGRNR